MRVIVVTHSKIPSRAANTIQVIKMCDAFASLGHEVHLVAAAASKSDDVDVHAFYAVQPAFEIHYLERRTVAGRGYGLIFGLMTARKARRLEAELVHSRDLYGAFFAKLLGLRVAFELHTFSTTFSRRQRFMLDWLTRRGAPSLVTTSSTLRAAVVHQMGVAQDRVLVAHNGADVHAGGEAANLSDGALKVGYVGQLYPGKGIEIIAQLARQTPWAEFHIAGGTEDDIAYWQERLGSLPNVHFHGFVPIGETNAFRAACDVLVAPYRRTVTVAGGGAESGNFMTPIKLFEYMAAGKAILVSDLPVAREVVVHGQEAVLCDPDDINAWLDALRYLRDHEADRVAMGNRARAKLERDYTWKARAKRVLSGIR